MFSKMKVVTPSNEKKRIVPNLTEEQEQQIKEAFDVFRSWNFWCGCSNRSFTTNLHMEILWRF